MQISFDFSILDFFDVNENWQNLYH